MRTRTWRPSGFQHRRRGFDSFRPCSSAGWVRHRMLWEPWGSPTSMPRSSSRTGCRSLTPVMRVRVPPGVSMRPWCQCRKHAALPAPQTGFESRRSLFAGLLVARMVACNHPSGVRFPGAPCHCSRTRLVARLGCLPGEAGSTPAESAPRRSSADPSATLRGWGTEVRILPARLRRRAGWAGAALMRRSSVVRFHGRRSPRSQWKSGGLLSLVSQVRALPGSSWNRLVVGEPGHPTDFGRRRSQVRVLPTRCLLSLESDAR
jgi:hypothetical protein